VNRRHSILSLEEHVQGQTLWTAEETKRKG
jgi:hypothetical protein